jgi:hypothetical protein
VVRASNHCVHTFLALLLSGSGILLFGLVVSVLAMGPIRISAACSVPAKNSGFSWVIKIPSAHIFRRGSKAVGPMS